MRLRTITTAMIAATPMLAICYSAAAAEFKLRGECRVQGAVVRLADVAEIVAADGAKASQLGAIELFPSPPANTKRYVRVRELQDILVAHGENLLECQFSGAALTAVLAAPEASATRTTLAVAKTPAEQAAKNAQQRAADLIVRYLRSVTSNSQPWQVNLSLSDVQARLVANSLEVKVTGGQSPWIGPQEFRLQVDSAAGPASIAVQATVSLPEAVVVAIRPLSRGATLRTDDLELQNLPGHVPSEAFHAVGDVVGKELTRPALAGQPLDASWVRSPALVKKGELVTVYARAAGITVKTIARSRDDGGQGELVSIESPADKSLFYARVSGNQEVEVFAHAMNAK